jgi:trehalose synthase
VTLVTPHGLAGTLPCMRPGLQPIEVGRRTLADYAAVAGEEEIERLRERARPLQGASVLHVSPPRPGGRVPELLTGLLPLLSDVGVRVEWVVALAGDAPNEVGAELREGLQGAESAIDDDAFAAYVERCEALGEALDPSYDAVVVHEPEPLAVAAGVGEAGPRLVWRCHLDASEPDQAAWDRAAPLAARYDAVVFGAEGFAPSGLEGVAEVAPAIDPLASKHHDLPLPLAGAALRTFGLDLGRPFCCQVGRFDRWKDPHTTVDAFALAKEELPELQLALAGTLEGGRAEDWLAVKEIADYAGGREDLHLLTSYTGVGALELNALERTARVLVQKSLREGFGLVVSEALWKRTPVVASAAGGVPLQMQDSAHGFLTEDVEDTAERIVELVRDPGLAVEMGVAGRERVRERFLVTRLLDDELRLLGAVLADTTATVES